MKYLQLIFGFIALGFLLDYAAQKVGWLRAVFFVLCSFFAVMTLLLQIYKLMGI